MSDGDREECDECGEMVPDNEIVEINGRNLCEGCFEDSVYDNTVSSGD